MWAEIQGWGNAYKGFQSPSPKPAMTTISKILGGKIIQNKGPYNQ